MVMPPRPWIPAPDTVRVDIITQLNQNGVAVGWNTIHVFKVGGWLLSDMTLLGGVIYNWWQVHYAHHLSAACQLTAIRVTRLDSQSDIVYSVPVTGLDHGFDNGYVLPPQTSFAIKLSSGLTGRSARGRWFVFGLTGNYTSGVGQVSASVATAWVGDLIELKDGVIPDVSGASWVVTSYQHNKAWRSVAEPFLITSIQFVDLYLDTQRRRAFGRGI